MTFQWSNRVDTRLTTIRIAILQFMYVLVSDFIYVVNTCESKFRTKQGRDSIRFFSSSMTLQLNLCSKNDGSLMCMFLELDKIGNPIPLPLRATLPTQAL